MKADGTPETEFEESMPLFASIMEANARGLQWTNDQLLASKTAELRRMQKNYVMLYAAMTKVYDKTDSATARDALDRFWAINEDAQKDLAQARDLH
jgi:hypothetical protein